MIKTSLRLGSAVGATLMLGLLLAPPASADAEGYLASSVEAGLTVPSADEHARAAMLTIYALGSLALHKHLGRHFDVDIRSTELADEPGFARYLMVQMEVFSGLLEPAVRAQYVSAITQLSEEDA